MVEMKVDQRKRIICRRADADGQNLNVVNLESKLVQDFYLAQTLKRGVGVRIFYLFILK